MDFPVLSKKLRKAELLIFFDLEATQINHQAIAFAMVCYQKKQGELSFDNNNPITYQAYIKTEDAIGPIVEEMTGIHKETLEEKGIPLHQVILDISKLIRHYKNRAFLSFGSLDIEILRKSIDFDNETEKNFFANLTKNHVDFQNYLFHRIIDKRGNSYSLAKFKELYNISEVGTPHDPFYDSVILKDIYLSYVTDKEKDIELILENYSINKGMDDVNKELTEKVIKDGKADKADFIHILEEHL